MDKNKFNSHEFDAIVVGSGTSGATIARELTKEKRRVLILERGSNRRLGESFWQIASMVNEVSVSGKMSAMRALTTGGTTAIYFAVADLPPLKSFLSMGVDLSIELKEALQELPVAQLPDELLGPQVIKLKESAMELGYEWKKKLMLIDQKKCTSGYCYEAKWKAKAYIEDATKAGAVLLNGAKVIRVLSSKGKAIGVEYRYKNKTCRIDAKKIVISAGSLASPTILRDSGIKDVVKSGFYCDPGFAMFGIVPGLKGRDNFLGSMSTEYRNGIAFGDVNLSRSFYRLIMLGKLKPRHFISFQKSIGIGVKIKDGLGGELMENGRFFKKLTDEENQKLRKGEEQAVKILTNAGAKHIFNSGLSAGHVGGCIRINEHIDEQLQTQYKNLYVCDGSILPEDVRVTPVLTLICLGKYMAKNLLSSL